MPYSFQELKEAYRKIGISKGRVVLVKTDLRRLGPYESISKTEVLKAHLRVLSDLVDLGKGTIVVPTASGSLCNTDMPFDLKNTPSERGILTEYIRRQKNAVRSRHPFTSYTALGADAERICSNVSRHSFGLESPKDRMFELDAMYLSVGVEPFASCTYVHHMELLMGVPYRYTKEFVHPIVQGDGSVTKELFYLFIWYNRNMPLKRNRNVKIFQHYFNSGYKLKEASLGQGKVYGYSCSDFCKTTADYLKGDIYGLLSEPPENRPYRI